MRAAFFYALAAIGLTPPVQAQPTIATSAGPDQVSVTVYRDRQREPDERMRLEWLNGFALISETRTIAIPAGETDLRFEGVAGGILPQSAIVTGLPDGVVEKNQDAWLLSPASLVERTLGRRVHVRRTSVATGAVREHEAIVRSGAGGALVLQTEEGFEALRCTGLSETPLYERVPEGLSARPTLSVRTRSSGPVTATVTLSYLATGFDWQADYVATLSEAGDSIDLFAWVTLASGDETSFVEARTQAVAGRVNREDAEEAPRPNAPTLALRCWPQGSTSDVPEASSPVAVVSDEEFQLSGAIKVEQVLNTLPQVFPAPPAMLAQQEELGDLKLYRIPEPVTVSANSQKQVAFLRRENVRAEIVYRNWVEGDGGPLSTQRVLRTRNRTQEGLGIPLPQGRLVLFAAGRERPILLGEGSLADRAVGEEVEVELGPSEGVRVVFEREGKRVTMTVTNDRPAPVRYEAQLPARVRTRTPLGTRNRQPLWVVTVPANGSATIVYRTRD